MRNTHVNPRQVLVGVRKGSHGAGRLALPGGHLELGESWEACAARELLEEANLAIHRVHFLHATNDIAIDGNPEKHYITLFMQAEIAPDSLSLQNMEPHKCEEWRWMGVEELAALVDEDPGRMFDPLLHFFQGGGLQLLLSGHADSSCSDKAGNDDK